MNYTILKHIFKACFYVKFQTNHVYIKLSTETGGAKKGGKKKGGSMQTVSSQFRVR